MAMKKVIKRSALTATQREQVRRVKERLAGDDYWLKELKRARRQVEWSVQQFEYMVNGARNAVGLHGLPGWSGPPLRRVAERMRALREFTRLVGYHRNSLMTEAEQDAAWDRWHVRFARALEIEKSRKRR